jgi:hypothetical protein
MKVADAVELIMKDPATVAPARDRGTHLRSGHMRQRTSLAIPSSTCELAFCDNPSMPDAPVSICAKHARIVWQFGNDLIQESGGFKRAARPLHGTKPGGHVYFTRCGDLIKIGFSRHPDIRARNLGGELLASTPGTLADERTMHHRFGHAWEHGEYFRAEPDLLAFIESLTEAV